MTPRTRADRADPTPGGAGSLRTQAWGGWFGGTVRLIIAPLVLLCSGFFTTDFLLSGLYTWHRTSRVLILTLTVTILAYEFVYKEQRARQAALSAGLAGAPAGEHADKHALRALLYSCVIPYAVGVLSLLILVRLAA